MTFSIITAVILVLLKGVSDAADDSQCKEVTVSFKGEEIEGAGNSLLIGDLSDWQKSERQDRGALECMDLCLRHPEAKAWSLRWFQNQKCSCFRTVTDSDPSAEYKSGKICECDLSYHPGIRQSKSVALPAFCQSAGGADVPPTTALPHGATCNLTCSGSYVGTPGAFECRARDWAQAGSRIVMVPEPRCRLNSTTVLYASIGGGLVAVLILFLFLVCCLRAKQKREKTRAEKNRQVVMRNAKGDEETVDGIDRRKSYKKATGHLSVDEESREGDLILNGRHDGIVYANVDLSDSHHQRQEQDVGAPVTRIGAPDIDPIYLEGSILNENEANQYVTVDNNRS